MPMSSKTYLFALTGLLFSLTARAQDIHFTMFDMSPLTLNPALIGDFHGTFRITGNYRIQWPTIAKYKTPAFGIDAPLFRGLGKNDWISFGLAAYQDKAGDEFGLKKTSGWIGGSYHLALKKDGSSLISIGVQSGGTSRSFDGIPRFQDPSDPAFPGSSGGGNDNKRTFADINAGLLFRNALNKEKTSWLNMGLSLYHLSQPNSALGGGGGGTGQTPGQDKQNVLINAHAQMIIPRGDLLQFVPGVVLHSAGGNFEVAGQLKGEMLINREKDFSVIGGLGYRVSDAAFAIFGARFKDLKVALAYDFNISGATSSTSGIGGYELGVSYIAKIYKKPVVKPVIFCPRF